LTVRALCAVQRHPYYLYRRRARRGVVLQSQVGARRVPTLAPPLALTV